MAVRHGYGKVAGTDALVFAYDTGDTRNSYRGEPTTNLNVDPLHLTRTDGEIITLTSWGGDTGYGEFKTNTSPVGGGMMFINHNTSNPEGSGGTYTDFPQTRYTLENGKTYTRSWYAKATKTQSISGHVCSCNKDSDNTYIVGGSITVTPEWQRYTHTFTYTGPTSSDWQFRHIIYSNNSVSIANVQLEEKSHATPFVNGTRSSTQGLLDLTGNSTINLANVSFDANAQMFFDGTDDMIELADNPQSGMNSVSWEFISYFDVVHDNETSTYRQLYIQESSVWIGQYYDYIGIDLRKDNNTWFDSDGGRNTNSKIGPVSSGQYYHVVFTWDGTNVKGYLNGELGFTTAISGLTGIQPGSTPRRIGRRSGNPLMGQLPSTKLYSRALTAAEVLNNYNQYKGRFNL